METLKAALVYFLFSVSFCEEKLWMKTNCINWDFGFRIP